MLSDESERIVQNKSRSFAIRSVRLYQHLCQNKHEYILSKQFLRCGTSIGANLAEAECAVSRKDFISKIYIAFKESSECLYWLDLLHSTDYLSDSEFSSINADCLELHKLLSAITKTLRNNC